VGLRALNYHKNMFYNWVAFAIFNFVARFGYLPEMGPRNVTVSRTMKIQGSACATTLHL
jgi:hypothetical protein